MVATYVLILLLLNSVLTNSDHTGAYSSPQYAKKIYPRDMSDLLPDKEASPFENSEDIERHDIESNSTQYGRSSLMETAGSFLSSTGGQVMSSLAKDFIARSTGSSQVGFSCLSQILSLNLTNLVILIVLKALVLAAGFFGAGAWKGHHYGRSLEENKNASYISEEEILLYLSYLVGQQTKDYGCLYKLSCQKPHQAALYASGAELLLQGTKLFQGNSVELQPYEEVSNGIRRAAAWGEKGIPCEKRFQCA